jgi:hypothetical protein
MTDLVAGRKLKSCHSSNKREGRAGNGRRARRSREEGARLGGTKIAKHAAAAGRASAACWNVSNGGLAASQGRSPERSAGELVGRAIDAVCVSVAILTGRDVQPYLPRPSSRPAFHLDQIPDADIRGAVPAVLTATKLRHVVATTGLTSWPP